MSHPTLMGGAAPTPLGRAVGPCPRSFSRHGVCMDIDVSGHANSRMEARAIRRHVMQSPLHLRRLGKKGEPRARLGAWVWHAVQGRGSLPRPSQIVGQSCRSIRARLQAGAHVK
eukprot:4168060-Pyramimonas_sp.AAC.1